MGTHNRFYVITIPFFFSRICHNSQTVQPMWILFLPRRLWMLTIISFFFLTTWQKQNTKNSQRVIIFAWITIQLQRCSVMMWLIDPWVQETLLLTFQVPRHCTVLIFFMREKKKFTGAVIGNLNSEFDII